MSHAIGQFSLVSQHDFKEHKKPKLHLSIYLGYFDQIRSDNENYE